MIFNTFQFRLFIRVTILAISLFVCAYSMLHFPVIYVCLIALVCLFQIVSLYHSLKRAHDEVQDFVQSIKYKDFTKHFNIKQAPTDLKQLREGFNSINRSFKDMSREKEMQYQYLQKILEIINTAIISYDLESGEVNWVNDTFKKIFGIPYLKNIHALGKRDTALYEAVIAIQSSGGQVISVQDKNEHLKILITATVFKTEGKTNKIVALQNINAALDENEGQAWQKLLSVMTHEIMNSIAPISSLANTLSDNLKQVPKELSQQYKDLEDIELGLSTIYRRSEGLLKFAQVYRNLNKISQPQLEDVFVTDLFENIANLMHPTLEKNKIELEIILKDPQLQLQIDLHLIEQIILNLTLNAIEALKEASNKKIIFTAFAEEDKRFIKISDTGSGMSKEVLDKIFIPFFSTKKNGSGIGLSLSKQIMLMHKGSIHAQSIEGQGTVFVLGF
jgi:two-component system, NtrC family, nitrogen regulation sensor histidine kinase NtrY